MRRAGLRPASGRPKARLLFRKITIKKRLISWIRGAFISDPFHEPDDLQSLAKPTFRLHAAPRTKSLTRKDFTDWIPNETARGISAPRDMPEGRIKTVRWRMEKTIDMKTLFLVLSAGLFALSCVSCVHSKSINYATVKRPPKAENYAMEILEPQDVKRPYKVIGTVEANAGARFNIQDPIEELRREARKMGADALLSPSQSPIGAGLANIGSGTGNGFYSGHVRDLFICKAIVWTD